MSIAPLGSYANPVSYNSPNASTGQAPIPASTAATSTSATSSDSPKLVTLSPEAQAVARLNAAGITVECVSLSNVPNLQELAGSGTQKPSGSTSSTTTSIANRELSESSFAQVLAGYGANSSQAAQYFKDIDTNGNGEISNGELLAALGDTASDTDSALSQGLLTLMNISHSGAVTGTEFTAFETSLVTAETAGS